MDVDGFWAIVDNARARAGGVLTGVPEIVTDALPRLSARFYDKRVR